MMWYWGSGYGWGMWVVGAIMMVAFWGGIFALVVYLINSFGRSRSASGDSAMEALRRRLAAGEITADEFDRLRKVLQG